MMKESTRVAIEENISRIGKAEFKKEDIKGISFETFAKYVKVKMVKHESFEEISVEELVNLLNNCAGDDCYNCDWEYRVINGKPYEVFKSYGWIIE